MITVKLSIIILFSYELVAISEDLERAKPRTRIIEIEHKRADASPIGRFRGLDRYLLSHTKVKILPKLDRIFLYYAFI